MDFKDALAAIKKLDNGADLASAIESEVDRLNGKNYEIIGEKRTATSKLATLESALSAIAKAIGLEGDTEAILSGAEGKVRLLVSEAAQLRTDKTALETRATEAEGKVQGLERKTKITQAAAKAGAAEAVLERLLGDKINDLTIADDGVKIGDKALKDYVEADETLKPFMPALFPSGQQSEQKTEQKMTEKPAPKLPSGSPGGTTPEKTNPVDAYMGRTYTGLKALNNKTAE